MSDYIRIRILRRPEVEHRTGAVGRQLDQLEAEGRFPRRVKLSDRMVGWVEDEVQKWCAERIAERDARSPRQRWLVTQPPR